MKFTSNLGEGEDGNPRVKISDMLPGIGGEYPSHRPNYITLNEKYVKIYEDKETSWEDKEAAQFIITTILLHEFTHYGDERKGHGDYPGEEGNKFEQAVYGIDEIQQNIMRKSVQETMGNVKRIIKESRSGKAEKSIQRKDTDTKGETDKETFRGIKISEDGR